MGMGSGEGYVSCLKDLGVMPFHGKIDAGGEFGGSYSTPHAGAINRAPTGARIILLSSKVCQSLMHKLVERLLVRFI